MLEGDGTPEHVRTAFARHNVDVRDPSSSSANGAPSAQGLLAQLPSHEDSFPQSAAEYSDDSQGATLTTSSDAPTNELSLSTYPWPQEVQMMSNCTLDGNVYIPSY